MSPKLVFYRPPNNFLFEINTFAEALTISASTPDGTVIASKDILLIRPPLIFNHGLFSSPSTWTHMVGEIQANHCAVQLGYVDWSRMNCSGFDDITPALVSTVAGAIRAQVARGAAATRVDVCGHSAGGVMVKWWVSELGNISRQRDTVRGWPPLIWGGASPANLYHTNDNFGVGYIRRFISIGSPFKGSAWGDAVAGIPYSRLLVIQNLRWVRGKMTGTLCLLSDLGASGTAASILGSLPIGMPKISWFPLVGIAWPNKHAIDLITSDDLLVWLADAVVNHLFVFQIQSVEELANDLGFTQKNSDYIVLASSQVDCLEGFVPPPPIGFSSDKLHDTTHDEETSNTIAALDVMEALDLWVNPNPTDPNYRAGYLHFNPNLSPR